jgi:hypothetical protein
MLPNVSGRPTIPGGEWFTGAGFGLFVHWDQASQQEIEISWPLAGRSIIPGVVQAEDTVSVVRYQSAAARFNPTTIRGLWPMSWPWISHACRCLLDSDESDTIRVLPATDEDR